MSLGLCGSSAREERDNITPQSHWVSWLHLWTYGSHWGKEPVTCMGLYFSAPGPHSSHSTGFGECAEAGAFALQYKSFPCPP